MGESSEKKESASAVPNLPALPGDERWTEIEHLPEWDEEFYYVYTAKKHGKWVMLKTLRPEYREDAKYWQMLEKEFEVRYNLAHPNIIMINDLEDVPGLGRCIITDDVYGLSLRRLIDEGKVTRHHIDQLAHQLVSAMQYIQTNHIVHKPIKAERIIFTENVENLKLIDVGFDQKEMLTPTDVADDVYNYGLVLREALDRSGVQDSRLSHVAARCLNHNPKKRYPSVQNLQFDIDGRSKTSVYLMIIIFLAVMVAVLSVIILNSK